MSKRPRPNHRRFSTDVAVFLSIIAFVLIAAAALLVLKSCHHRAEIGQHVVPYTAPPDAQKPVRFNASSAPCAFIEGEVVGAIIPNSTLTLYRTSSTEFRTVLDEIRTTTPLKRGIVNASKGFNIGCLSTGNYALVIPSSSYF